MNELGRLLTAEQLSDELGITRRRIYRWREEHGLPAVAIGRALYFSPPAVAAWLEWLTTDPAEPAPATNGAGTSTTADIEKAPRLDASPGTSFTSPTAA